jgi:hypothetical protein
MVDRVIKETETETPRETVIVHDDDHRTAPADESSRTGLIVGIIVVALIVILLLIFGRSWIGDGNSTNTTNPSPSNGTNSTGASGSANLNQ